MTINKLRSKIGNMEWWNEVNGILSTWWGVGIAFAAVSAGITFVATRVWNMISTKKLIEESNRRYEQAKERAKRKMEAAIESATAPLKQEIEQLREHSDTERQQSEQERQHDRRRMAELEYQLTNARLNNLENPIPPLEPYRVVVHHLADGRISVEFEDGETHTFDSPPST